MTFALGPGTGQAATPIPLAEAKQAFAEAHELAARDAGKLWGCSLDGPMMFVDSATRVMVANQRDPASTLHEEEGVFIGVFPAELNVANESKLSDRGWQNKGGKTKRTWCQPLFAGAHG